MSLRDIAPADGKTGIRWKRGGQWFAQQVKQLLITSEPIHLTLDDT